jgi:hypothetical protein
MISLNEGGLLRNDLDYLIMPLVDIDNYESKIDNAKAVVLAFYVFEQEPAKDLEHFIEKGNFEILDAETSPAPTSDGYYVVFIEIPRNMELPELIMGIVGQINNLSNVKEWQFKTLHSEEVYELTEENLTEHINMDPLKVPKSSSEAEQDLEDEKAAQEKTATDEKPVAAESAVAILQDGLMEGIIAHGSVLTLMSSGVNKGYRVKSISTCEPSVPVMIQEIGSRLVYESTKLSKMLGQAYTVDTVEDGLLVSHDLGYMILQPID